MVVYFNLRLQVLQVALERRSWTSGSLVRVEHDDENSLSPKLEHLGP